MNKLTLSRVEELAQRTAVALNGRNGDPSLAASWINERDLAMIVLALLRRIKTLHWSVEINP